MTIPAHATRGALAVTLLLTAGCPAQTRVGDAMATGDSEGDVGSTSKADSASGPGSDGETTASSEATSADATGPSTSDETSSGPTTDPTSSTAGTDGSTSGSSGSTGDDGTTTTDDGTTGTSTGSTLETTGSTGEDTGDVDLGPSAGCGVPLTDDWYSDYLLEFGATTNQVSIMVDATPRRFLIRFPLGYDETIPYPIVFSLHGADSSVDSAWGYNPPTEWPNQAVITVLPEGIDNNWDFLGDGVDVDFFDAINAFVAPRLCIDQNRRFVTGVSGGAIMMHTLACARADWIRAIGAPAGRLEAETTCSGTVSAFLIHGEADATVLLDEGLAARDDILARNGCSNTPSAHPLPDCVVYDDCTVEEVVWCQHAGGHVDHITLGLRDDVLAFFQSMP